MTLLKLFLAEVRKADFSWLPQKFRENYLKRLIFLFPSKEATLRTLSSKIISFKSKGLKF